MNNLPTDIFELAEVLQFSELSDKEQALVRLYMSEADYNDLHDGLSFSKGASANDIVHASDRKHHILNALPSTAPTLVALRRNTPIVWKVAAGICALLAMAAWFLPKRTIVQQEIVQVHDTIVQQAAPILRIKVDTVFRDRIVLQDQAKTSPTVKSPRLAPAARAGLVSNTVAVEQVDKELLDSLTETIGFTHVSKSVDGL